MQSPVDRLTTADRVSSRYCLALSVSYHTCKQNNNKRNKTKTKREALFLLSGHPNNLGLGLDPELTIMEAEVPIRKVNLHVSAMIADKTKN